MFCSENEKTGHTENIFCHVNSFLIAFPCDTLNLTKFSKTEIWNQNVSVLKHLVLKELWVGVIYPAINKY